MEKFLLEDYLKKQKGKKAAKNDVKKAKIRRAKKLFNDGLRDIGVLAEALDVSEETVKIFLGKKRTEICLGIVKEDVAEKIPVNSSPLQQTKKSKECTEVRKRFTEKDAEKYAKERDEEIRKYFLLEGFSVGEIAQKLRMTEGQVRERLTAIGLPVYSEEELRKEKERQNNLEKNKKCKQSKKRRKKVKSSEPEEKEESKKEVVHQVGYRSFEEIKKAIGRFIKNRESIKALDIARYYSIETHSDFLTEEERKKLETMADTIKIFRVRDRKRRLKER